MVALATKKADKKEPTEVESSVVDGHTDHAVLTLNGTEQYRLDTQQLLALRKQLDAAAVGANY